MNHILILLFIFLAQNELICKADDLISISGKNQSIIDTTGMFENYVEPIFPKIIFPSQNLKEGEPDMSHSDELGTMTFVVYFELGSGGIIPSTHGRITPLYFCGNRILPQNQMWIEAKENLEKAVKQWRFNKNYLEYLTPCAFCNRGITILVSFDLVNSKSELVILKSIIIKK